MSDPTLREYPLLQCIWMERIKQDAKWGVQNRSDLAWLAVLAEEFGEVGECVCETSVNPTDKSDQYYELLEYELIQVAAVATAWVENIRRREEVPDEAV